MVFSNAPSPLSPTGYGVQTALFAPRIRDMGHEVVISCMTGITGFPSEWEGITLLPTGLTGYSSDILPEHARHFFGRKPGLVIVHYDAWAIGPDPLEGLASAAWAPVHCDKVSAPDRAFYALTGTHPIAYSRHGEQAMRAAGLAPSYVPHGVDTSVFKPLTGEERAMARRELRLPDDAFVVAAVGANKGTDPPRKGWGELFAAFAQFRKRHREAVLLCHTMAATPDQWGLDLRPIINDLGIGNAVIFSDDYAQVCGLYPDGYVAKLTGCADVLANPSWGEGFGLAILQAQATGVPVIVGDNSAQRELCAAGWKVECQPYWQWRDQAWWAAPSIKGITRALEKAWNHRGDVELRERARQFAEGYDADLVAAQYWKPTLEMLEQLAGAARVRPPQFKLEANTAGHPTGNYTSEQEGVPLPTREADGLRWLARGPHTDDWIAVAHEDALAPLLESLLPEGGVFLDVGAHVGRWALRLAAKASQVVAVEANPDTAAVLRYHIALNNIGNVQVIEAAAWDTHAKLAMTDHNQQVTGGSARVQPAENIEAGHVVEAWPLDALLLPGDYIGAGGFPERVDLVKLDVEGADLHALEGMRGLLAAHRPVLFIEDHSIYGYYEHAELLACLDGLGYDARPFTAHLAGDRQAPYVVARPREIGDREDADLEDVDRAKLGISP